VQSRIKAPKGEDRHDQREARQAEDLLHQRKSEFPQHDPYGDPDEGHPQQVVQAGDELDHEGETADLGGDRQQVDEERRAEVDERPAGPEAFADDVEDGAL
jgi:hypothetical protein